MKKTLLVLAIFGSFAGTVSAQTNVTVYGLVDVGITSERGGPSGSGLKLESGIHSGSRLGFKGSEDLGGGLSAIFTLENGFNPDTGSMGQGGRIFGRQAFVGLKSDLGTFTAGRQYTPLFYAVDGMDPVDGIAGGSSNIIPRGGVRMDNTIKYASPNLSGFTGELAYGFGEVAGNTSSSRIVGALLSYANGPLAAKLAHHNANNTAGTDSAKTTFLGGSFDFKVAKAFLNYGINKGTGAADSRDALIGAQVPFGASTIMASYLRRDDKSAANNDANQVQLAYTYAISKRTNIYTSYTRIDNENTLVFKPRNGDSTGDKEFNVGIRHKF